METSKLHYFWKTLCILIHLMVFVNQCQSQGIRHEEHNGEITVVITDIYLVDDGFGNVVQSTLQYTDYTTTTYPTYPTEPTTPEYTTKSDPYETSTTWRTTDYTDFSHETHDPYKMSTTGRSNHETPDPYKMRTIKNIDFKTDYYNKENVVNLYISSAIMKVFTSDFCNTFPNLRNITASGLEIEKIDKNAFDNCLELKKLSMSQNNIEFLDNSLFEKNVKLQFLNFDRNPIKYVNAEVFKKMNQLNELSLRYTDLLDIDLEKIINYTPVQQIQLEGTKISCRRWKELNNTAKNNEIFLNYYYYDDYQCTDEKTWSKLIMEIDTSNTLLEDKLKIMYKRIKKNSIFYGTEMDTDTALTYFYSVVFVMSFTILILSIITIVSLICCCKAHYQRYVINQGYQTIPEYNN
jgi:hypothetical protein